jgi:thiol-disulfide isomerase/thioredoxin
MESRPNGRRWRKVFGALALGLIAVAGVFGTALAISEDLRLLYALGALLLFLFSAWLGSESLRDWPNFLLLYVPLAGLFSFFVLRQLPFLWPQLLLWAVAIVVGVFLRFLKNLMLPKLFAIFGFLAISVLYCWAYVPGQLKRATNHLDVASAPAFSFQPVSEGDVPVAATPGKVLLIDFFGTWCPPCIAELPELQLVRSTLSKRDDIQFVVVATNSGGDTPERLRNFGRVRHITLPLAFDPGGKAHAAFGLSGFPGIVVIDRIGHVRLTRQGFNSSETSFRADLVQLLKSLN